MSHTLTEEQVQEHIQWTQKRWNNLSSKESKYPADDIETLDLNLKTLREAGVSSEIEKEITEKKVIELLLFYAQQIWKRFKERKSSYPPSDIFNFTRLLKARNLSPDMIEGVTKDEFTELMLSYAKRIWDACTIECEITGDAFYHRLGDIEKFLRATGKDLSDITNMSKDERNQIFVDLMSNGGFCLMKVKDGKVIGPALSSDTQVFGGFALGIPSTW